MTTDILFEGEAQSNARLSRKLVLVLMPILPFEQSGFGYETRAKSCHQPEIAALRLLALLNFPQHGQHRDAAHVPLVVQDVKGWSDLFRREAHLASNDLDDADASRVQREMLKRCWVDFTRIEKSLQGRLDLAFDKGRDVLGESDA